MFDPPGGERLERILLPVPTERTKGVLVFPTVDGKVIAGPTAVDQEDKDDWSVRPQARQEIQPQATAMWPPLEGAEPIAAYAGLRPAGRGVNYLIEPSRACPAARQRRGDPLHRPDRIARDRGTRLRARRAARRDTRAPSDHSSRARRRASRVPWWRRAAEYRVAMSLLLGIDEGTSAVKAILFDARSAAAARGAAREAAAPSAAGMGRAGPGGRRDAPSSRRSRRCSQDAPGEVVACGLDHQGESVLAWDAESGRALTPVVTWQDKRSQEVLDRLEQAGLAERIQELQRPAARPVLLGREARLAARARRGVCSAPARPGRCGWARSTRSCATGSARASAPTRRPRRARSSVRPSGTPSCSRSSACRERRAARDRRHGGRPRHAAPPVVAGGAAAARTLPRPAGGARGRRLRRAGAHQGHLRHRRVRARQRRRRAPGRRRAGCFRRSRGGSQERSSGRSTAASSRRGRCSSGCRATSASRPTRRPSRASPREVEDAGGVRVLPALAGSGAPWWRPAARAVVAGLTGGARRAHVARATLEAIAWRVADILAVIREQSRPSTCCASTAG